LKPRYDGTASKFAFNAKLRRYATATEATDALAAASAESAAAVETYVVGRCKLIPVETRIESAWIYALETKM